MKTLSIPDINVKPMSKFHLKLWVTYELTNNK